MTIIIIIRMAKTRFIACFLLLSWPFERDQQVGSTSRTDSINGLRKCDCPRWHLRTPLSAGKGDNPISCLASAGLNWEWTDTFDHDGRALLVVLTKYLAFSRHLSEKDQAFVHLSVVICEITDQENAPIPVDLYFTVCEIGDLYSDRP